MEIEKVQQRATKMIQDLGNASDGDKLGGFRPCYLRMGSRGTLGSL